MKNLLKVMTVLAVTLLMGGAFLSAQGGGAKEESDQKRWDALDHRLNQLEKAVDDILWFQRLSDVAWVDKLFIAGPPPARIDEPTLMGAKNPVKFWTYLFLPKAMKRGEKLPLLILPHGGVHANFTTYHTHIVRELVSQGYAVAAPEYRGSTGYGAGFYRQVDYGGLEVEDVDAARKTLLECYGFLDSRRVGLIGWSHGGLITLMNLFQHPQAYAVGFAGVPVSDLVARMGYSDDEYRELFSAKYHIGKDAREDVNEYRRRSPVFHASKLQTPLLIHTNTNDDDVYVLEVESLINALKANGKKFSWEIFQDAPGGHSFDRIDTPLARKTRLKIYAFLADYLHPRKPITSLELLDEAGYLPVP